MKRLAGFIGVLLLLWGCTNSQPQREIMSTFRTFLSDVSAGNQRGILATAPFLASLPAGRREAAIQSFRRFADADPDRVSLRVIREDGGTYELQVSVRDAAGAIIVPFHRNNRGAWEISPVIEAARHIDVIPAR